MSGMEIFYADFRKMHEPLRPALDAAWKRVTNREWFIGGEEDRAFEKAFAEYCGVISVTCKNTPLVFEYTDAGIDLEYLDN